MNQAPLRPGDSRVAGFGRAIAVVQTHGKTSGGGWSVFT